MILLPSQLRAICPKSAADLWAPALSSAAAEFGITMPLRLAAWLANLAHESSEFRRLSENLNYSATRLVQVFPKRFTADTAPMYAGKPEKIANLAYANRIGNGSPVSGDGWRFRGRGIIQHTGRANYAELATALSLPLLEEPDRLLDPLVSARAAGWFWASRQLNALADAEAFSSIVVVINGGKNGMGDRLRYYARAKAVLLSRGAA